MQVASIIFETSMEKSGSGEDHRGEDGWNNEPSRGSLSGSARGLMFLETLASTARTSTGALPGF
jgi:hypothetical protein